jgi:hypothetical protein
MHHIFRNAILATIAALVLGGGPVRAAATTDIVTALPPYRIAGTTDNALHVPICFMTGC